jgi:NAD(P)H-flavin reductase
LNLTRVPILEEAPDDWQGESGYITTEILTRYLPDNLQDLEYFLCGPKEMLQAVREQLIELGVPRTQIHSELFDMA